MMASYVNTFTTLICLLSTVMGHQMLTNVNPQELARGLTDSLDLTCSLNVSNTQNSLSPSSTSADDNDSASHVDIDSVVSVFIFKVTDFKPLIVATVSTATPATTNVDLEKSKAYGYVDGSVDPEAYLQITWTHPGEDQEGNYSCVIHAIDVLGQQVTLEQSAQVMAREPTFNDVTGFVVNLRSNLEDLQNKIDQQEVELMWIGQQKTELYNLIKELQNTITDQKTELLSKMEKLHQAQGVGFTAQIDFQKQIDEAGVIIFDLLLYNIGGHYNPSTGIFTAPSDGTYLASLTIQQLHSGVLNANIYHRESAVDNDPSLVCYTNTFSNYGSSACVGLVTMKKEDELYAWVDEIYEYPYLLDASTFSCVFLY